VKRIDVGHTVGIVANVGVVIGLIFLGLELRQTQSAMQAQAYQTRALDAIAWNFEIAKDENLRRVQSALDSGNVDFGAVDKDDRQIAMYLLDLIKTDVDNEHYQYQQGYLDPAFYEGMTIPMIKLYGPQWRELGIGEGRAEFRREVDQILAR